MWKIVCIGPSPLDRTRRVEDHGPLHPDQRRTNSIAAYLRATGLYESVKVVGSSVKAAAVLASPDLSFKMDDNAAPSEHSPGDAPSMPEAQAAARAEQATSDR